MQTYPDTLPAEYRAIIADVPNITDDAMLIRALGERGDWTEDGAHELVRLAHRYGTSILRNALALAEALDVEDGDAGM